MYFCSLLFGLTTHHLESVKILSGLFFCELPNSYVMEHKLEKRERANCELDTTFCLLLQCNLIYGWKLYSYRTLLEAFQTIVSLQLGIFNYEEVSSDVLQSAYSRCSDCEKSVM